MNVIFVNFRNDYFCTFSRVGRLAGKLNYLSMELFHVYIYKLFFLVNKYTAHKRAHMMMNMHRSWYVFVNARLEMFD